MSTLSCSDTDNAENSSPEKQPRKADAKRRNLKTQAERRRRARLNERFQDLHDILHTSSNSDVSYATSTTTEMANEFSAVLRVALEVSRLERPDGSLAASAIAPVPCASSSTAGVPTSSASNSDQRMEKAEILEKAVKRINLLESNLKSSESREERCFVTGFKHCAMQLYKFVQGQSDLDSVSKQRICSTLLQKIRESNVDLRQAPADTAIRIAKPVFQPATSSPIKRPSDHLTSSPSKPFPGGAPLELKAFHQNNKENSTRRHVAYHEDPPGMQTLLEDAYEESPNDSRLNASACCTVNRSPLTVSNNWKSHGQLRTNNGFRPVENAPFAPSSKPMRPESSSSKMARLDENFSPARGASVWRPW